MALPLQVGRPECSDRAAASALGGFGPPGSSRPTSSSAVHGRQIQYLVMWPLCNSDISRLLTLPEGHSLQLPTFGQVAWAGEGAMFQEGGARECRALKLWD